MADTYNTEAPLFESHIEADLDQTWEALNEYDRYEIDTTILKARFDIEALHDHHGYRDQDWTIEHRKHVRELSKLLDARYEEITAGEDRKSPHDSYYYDCGDRTYAKLSRVVQEWKNRYFLLRTESASMDHYNEWVWAHAKFAGLNENRLHIRDRDSFGFKSDFRAISSLELVPLYGSAGLRIIVPPHVTVSGNPGHSSIYLWEEVDKPTTKHIELFPSTRRMLVDRLGLTQFKDIPMEDVMNDTEAELTEQTGRLISR